jgi:hypothetical protein
MRVKPTNQRLYKLFDGVDKVVFIEGGVSNGKALGSKPVLTISDVENISTFKSLMEIKEGDIGFCMCLGDYGVELYSSNQIRYTLGFHHGVSLRYDSWTSDAELAKSMELLYFLSKLGMSKPLNDRTENKIRSDIGVNKENSWFKNAPNCFSAFKSEIDGLDQKFLPLLVKELEDEIPNKSERILRLLELYGFSDHLWTFFPSREGIPHKILTGYDFQELLSAYAKSLRTEALKRGLGRFLCSHEIRKRWEELAKLIPLEIINDIEDYFHRVEEKEGSNRIIRL